MGETRDPNRQRLITKVGKLIKKFFYCQTTLIQFDFMMSNGQIKDIIYKTTYNNERYEINQEVLLSTLI